MEDTISILLTEEKLNLQACFDFVKDPRCGGMALFVGTVRNTTQNKEVIFLDFSAYEAMAVKEMQKIAEQALVQFAIKKNSHSSCKRTAANWRYPCDYCRFLSSQKRCF